MMQAIQWRWPGARCVIRGDVLERWEGPMARPSDAEIAQAVADYTPDVAPKLITTRDLMELRLTEDEHFNIAVLARRNKTVSRLMHQLLAGGTVDLNSPKFIAGLAYLKAVGIPAVWPDAAAANSRIAQIRA